MIPQHKLGTVTNPHVKISAHSSMEVKNGQVQMQTVYALMLLAVKHLIPLARPVSAQPMKYGTLTPVIAIADAIQEAISQVENGMLLAHHVFAQVKNSL